jgi:N-acetyl-anhydromuramyl-L-alanine amidase AmpD
MQSCVKLCKILSEKYNIPKENFIGHSDVAPARKIDPGIFFDWQSLSKQGFSIWHDLNAPSRYESVCKFGDSGEYISRIQTKLKMLGYNIDVNGRFNDQTNFVVRSFLAKFYPDFIKDLGLEYYNNPESKYNWNSYADNILNKLTYT